MEDIGSIGHGTDFDVVFSLRGVPWDVTPQTLFKSSRQKQKIVRRPSLSLCSVYRWDEAKEAFRFVGNKNYRRAKGFSA